MKNDNAISLSNERLVEISCLEENKKIRVMEKYGREYAVSQGLPEKARQIRSMADDKENMDLLFRLFKETDCSLSANLYKKGETIHWEWNQCMNPLVKDIKTSSSFLCHFTRGYVKEIFEELFDKFMEVDLTASVLQGDKSCSLAIIPFYEIKQWIGVVLKEMSSLAEEKGAAILERCGRACGQSHDLALQAKEIADQIEDKHDMDLLFSLYKEKAYHNSPRLYKKGNIIYLEYHQCGCPLVRAGKIDNPFFCHCTRGYTKERFENLFAKPVRVKLLESILRGDKICKQAVTILDE